MLENGDSVDNINAAINKIEDDQLKKDLMSYLGSNYNVDLAVKGGQYKLKAQPRPKMSQFEEF